VGTKQPKGRSGDGSVVHLDGMEFLSTRYEVSGHYIARTRVTRNGDHGNQIQPCNSPHWL